MNFEWIFDRDNPQEVKYFLKEKGVSKSLLAKIKYQGGNILVNREPVNVRYRLTVGDRLFISIPDEKEHETLLAGNASLDIHFEDEHYLVVNKPANTASIPSQYHPNGTMANHVKAYYKQQGYKDQVIHVVTRLDRDTTGLMLFAKHGYAHALMDKELRQKKLIKLYQALVSGEVSTIKKHGRMIQPIGRDTSSLLKRKVTRDGKAAETEYWLLKKREDLALVRIQLHTGRTHQIRVHFCSLHCSLVGDELYGGAMNKGIERQALHCCELSFIHPFTMEAICITSDLPNDMLAIANQNSLEINVNE